MRRLLLLMALMLLGTPAAGQQALLPPLQPLTIGNAAGIEALARLGRGVVRDVQWSPDGADLAVATTLGVWLQPADASAEPRLVEGQLGASAIAYRPDGRTLASGGDDGSLMLIDRFSGTEQLRVERHIYAVMAVSYSADGAWLASVDASGVVRVWRADDLHEQAVFQGRGVPWRVALNADGSAVAVSTRAGIDLWRVDTPGAPVASWPLMVDAATTSVPLVFTGADSVAFAHGATVYRAQIGQGEPETATLEAEVIDLQARADGTVVITHGDRQIEAWPLGSETRLALLDDPDRLADFARFSPDWSRAVSIGSEGPRVHLWTLGERSRADWLPGYTGPLIGLAHEGTTLAAVDDAGYVTLWNPTSGARVTTFETWAAGEPGPALAASPDGQWMASGGDDSVVRMLNATTGEAVRMLHGHIRSVTALAFNADSTMLASGSLDGAVHLWNVATGELLARLDGHSSGVTGLVFSARGGLLASASHDGTVRLWGVPLE